MASGPWCTRPVCNLLVRLGISYRILTEEKHGLLGAVDLNMPLDDNLKVNTGIEYLFNNLLFIRGGFRIGEDLASYTAGTGVQFPLMKNTGEVDYAFVPYGDLGITHRIGLRIKLNK